MACVSHAILNEVGIDRLRKSSIDELITTDTVLRPPISGVKITTLSVAGLLGEAIKRINSNSSVTSLFEFKGGATRCDLVVGGTGTNAATFTASTNPSAGRVTFQFLHTLHLH